MSYNFRNAKIKIVIIKSANSVVLGLKVYHFQFQQWAILYKAKQNVMTNKAGLLWNGIEKYRDILCMLRFLTGQNKNVQTRSSHQALLMLIHNFLSPEMKFGTELVERCV
jgi:hypothetical protein